MPEAAPAPSIQPADRALRAAVDAINAGGVVGYPTETCYGLAAAADDAGALSRLSAIKRRPPGAPLSLLVADGGMLEALVGRLSPAAEALIARFWPGPLTLVVPTRRALLPPLLNADRGVGLRCSSDPVAAALVAAVGKPVTATSANVSGAAPARDAAAAALPGVTLVLDDGRREGAPSTVVELVDGRVRVLRQGGLVVPAAEGGPTG